MMSGYKMDIIIRGYKMDIVNEYIDDVRIESSLHAMDVLISALSTH